MEKLSEADTHKAQSGLGYGSVFLLLAIITAVEIWLGSLDLIGAIRTGIFLVLSLAKASLVAAYFMHLNRDSRLYTFIFVAPAVLLLVFVLVTAVP